MSTRKYKLYDSKKNLLYEASTLNELSVKSGICTQYLSKYKNTGILFKKPFTKERYLVELEIIEDEIIIPKYRSIPVNLRVDVVDLPNEKWLEIPQHPRNFVSNMGRVIFIDMYGNTRFSSITSSKGSTKNYLDCNVYNPETVYVENTYRLGRVVANLFIDPAISFEKNNTDTYLEVYYKNGDSTDNRASNLEVLTHQEIIQRTIQQGIQVGTKKRLCYAEKDGIKRIYESITDMMEDITGVKSPSHGGRFNACAKNGYKVCGYKVGYLD